MKIDRTVAIYILVAIVVMSIAAPLLFQLYIKSLMPVSAPSKETVSMTMEEGAALNSIVNPLPTDDQIRDSIRAHNKRQKITDQAIADAKSKIDATSREIRMSQNATPSVPIGDKQETAKLSTEPTPSKTPEYTQ